MSLEELGYTDEIGRFRKERGLEGFDVGRVISEHKERYIIRTDSGEREAEITGTMRFTAEGREDFPAVGDWVALTAYDDDFAIINSILPRSSIIKRQAVGQSAEVQVIATNIDVAFIVQAVDRDYNINRLERYLTICHSSGVVPAIVLTKTDLADEIRLNEIRENIKARIGAIPVFAISNETQDGYASIKSFIAKGTTYCMLGSSGVGKSTLINNLSGRTVMKTDSISQSTNKGRHVTSHRELIVLGDGGILIDNPGMKQVGIADAGDGLEVTFDEIVKLARICKFKDCTHVSETGCAVREAVENGDLDEAAYENYLKMEREKAHYESSVLERRKKDKAFGKMLKNYKKDTTHNHEN